MNQMYSKVGNQGLVKKNEKELGNSDFRTVIRPTCTQGIRTENTTVPAAAPAVRKVLETCHVLKFRISSNDLRHFGQKMTRKPDGSGLICQRPTRPTRSTAPPCLLASTDFCKAPIDRIIQIHLKGLGRKKLVTRPPDHLSHLSNLSKDSCSS